MCTTREVVGNRTVASSKARLVILAAGAAMSVGMMASQTLAQYTWIGNATGTQNFTDTTKWLAGSAPGALGGAAATLNFSPGYFASATTATNNNANPIATPFQVNAMTFNNMCVPNGFTVAGAANNVFQMTSASPSINLTGAGASTISGTGAALQLADNLTISGSGLGSLTISSVISESVAGRSVTISGTPATQATRVVTLGGANTFTGGLFLDGGNVSFSGASSMGPAGSTFTVTSNGGVLTGTINPLAAKMQVNGALRSNGGTVNFTATNGGVLAGTSSGSIMLSGGSLTLNTSGSLYNGSISTDRQDVPWGSGTAGGTLTLSGAAGALPNQTSYSIRAGGHLIANSGTAAVLQNPDRINNSATINLESGFLQVQGPLSTSTTPTNLVETVGAINGSGMSVLSAEQGSANLVSTTLAVASVSRVDRGTFVFRGLNLGNGTANSGNVTIASSPAADQIGGGGAATTKDISILPYAVGDITNSGYGSSFVTMNGNSVRPLVTSEYAATLAAIVGDTNNVRLTATNANAGTLTINSLVLTDNAAATTGGSVTGAGTLNITSGAILANTTVSTGVGSGYINNNINFGAAEGQIYTPGFMNLSITGNMTGTGGFTKSGTASSQSNLLTLSGDNSGLTGTLTINSGPIQFGAPNNLPGTGQIVTNGIAATSVGGVAGLFYTGTAPLTLSRDIASNGGTLVIKGTDATGTGIITVSGLISGPGGLSLGTGTGSAADIYFTNTGNTYTGPTTLSSGGAAGIHIAGDGVFGSGNGALSISNVTITLEGDWTSSRIINNGGSTNINTNGHTAVWNGPLVNFNSSGGVFSGAGFTKSGNGSLTLNSNTNGWGGAITVSGGSLIVNGTIPGATNTVAVSGGATLGGSGTIWRPVTIAATGVLSPGNSPGILTINGNVTFSAGAFFNIEINGATPGNTANSYDQLAVATATNTNGLITLANATLSPSLGFVPSITDMYWIINNQGTNAISGTFNGLIEGAVVTLGVTWDNTPVTAQISYNGNYATGLADHSGNDVVLYNVVPTPGTAGLMAMGGLLAARRRRR